jgi:putative endonuclease
MHYVYVLRGIKSGRWYTGCTGDLRKRFKEHNEGKSTYSKRETYELIYYEACLNMKDAFAREKYLKTGIGKRYLKNRLKRFLALTG